LTNTRYARNGDLHIAYQVLGDGPTDLLYLSGGVSSIDSIDDLAEFRRFHQQLASFSRLIRFDQRGIGLSDPIRPGEPPTLEQWTSDAVAVLDAAGSERVALLGGADEGALVAMLLAATRPDRVSHLVLVNPTARYIRADDYPAGIPARVMEQFEESSVGEPAAAPDFADLKLMAPRQGEDARVQAWWQQAGRRRAGPAMEIGRAHV